MIPTVSELSRAIYFVATPDAAPVRICPMRLASITATSELLDVSYNITWKLMPPAPPGYDFNPAIWCPRQVANITLYAPELVGNLRRGSLNASPFARALNASSTASTAIGIVNSDLTCSSVMNSGVVIASPDFLILFIRFV